MQPTEEQLKNRQVATQTSPVIGNPNFSGVTTGGEYATLNSPKPISVSGLNQNVQPFVPPPETPTPNYSAIAKGAIAGATTQPTTYTTPNGAVLDVNGNIITPAKTDTTSSSESIQEKTNKILAEMGVSTNQPAQKSFADQYNELLQKPEYVEQKKRVDDLKAQLAAVEAETTTSQLGLETQDVRRTAGVLDRMQGQIAREQAIKTLPLTAKLNFEQGRLESAQADIRTLLDLTFKDEQLKTERADKAYERAYAIATNEEKKELDKLKEENNAKKEENQNLFTLKQTYIKQALDNGDYKTASEIATATTNEQLQQIAGGMTAKASISGAGSGFADETVQSYVDLLSKGQISLANVPQNIRSSVVRASGGVINKPLSDTAIKDIQQSESAVANLEALKKIVENNLQFVGPISGLARFNPYSKARQAQAEIDRVRQQVGKTLEGGVLRKEDEEKYKKILATLADTPQTAIYKIDSLINALQRDVATYKTLQQETGRFIPGGTQSKPEDLRAKYKY